MFSERIKELRIKNHMPQRQLSAALDGTATYCKIEKKRKKSQKEASRNNRSDIESDKNELVTLWLADKVYDVVGDEINVHDILNVVKEYIVKYGRDI